MNIDAMLEEVEESGAMPECYLAAEVRRLRGEVARLTLKAARADELRAECERIAQCWSDTYPDAMLGRLFSAYRNSAAKGAER